MHNEHGGEGHQHSHLPMEGGVDRDKAIALLHFMHVHNTQHAEELHALTHQLEDLGLEAAAGTVAQALEYYRLGNDKISAALEQM